MKRKTIILCMLAVVLLSSCSKDPVKSVCGSYSFKSGGYLEIRNKATDSLHICHILPESGQMRILSSSGNSVKVTMNVALGSPEVFDGTVEDGVIRLSPQEKRVPLFRDLTLLDIFDNRLLSVSGEGEKFDGTIIFRMDYRGDGVVSSHVNCIATANE